MKKFTSYKIAPEHAGLTVETYLKQILKYSGRHLQKLTRKKGIRIHGRPSFLQKILRPGDIIQVCLLQDTSYGVQPEKGPVTILYEDTNMYVLNKPPYQLVHPTGYTTSGTLANYLAHYLQAQQITAVPRAVHRLDRNTSGCILFAKNSQSQFLLEEQLKTKQLTRRYWALVQGNAAPACGTINAAVAIHPSRPNRRIISVQGDPAVTHYRTLRRLGDATLLELTLDTGRTHQIRLHLAHIGHPIIGDAMYGVASPYIARQALHAASVTFRRISDKKPITVHAPLPQDLRTVLEYYSPSHQRLHPAEE
ncbi:hypothetical protein P22_0990 [Propionispora sp. 2/2-37]|uniref:RluA family pseudouridine synthase n=1 Tax=Propionispora sp. 2/2-37 TaxID=1677858 RepID=UPI0006BB7524|nr:RluA family pseudouridine synthase [Propionispora sp. 2/2-37]CUH94921.1 hypothetical protein P22_0990 [Propionispora sp. 2/2-37]